MKNNSQMITARQGNRIMILEIFSAAAMFLPQIALQKSYHSGIVVVVMASVMAGIYLWIVDHAARGVSIENAIKKRSSLAMIPHGIATPCAIDITGSGSTIVSFFPREPTVLANTPRKSIIKPANDRILIGPSLISPR